MRKIVIFLNIIFLVQLLNAQTIELLNPNNQVITNSTVPITSSFYIGVSNLTNEDIDVVCEITEFIIPDGDMGISMCWGGTCSVLDDPETFTSPLIVGTYTQIPANFTNTTEGHFEYFGAPSGYAKISLKFYKFHDEENFVTLTFENGTGISEINLTNSLSVFPNPAKSSTVFSYNVDNYQNSFIDIYNIIGKQIDRIILSNREAEIEFDLSTYNSGVYFYSLIVDNKIISTKKLIVE